MPSYTANLYVKPSSIDSISFSANGSTGDYERESIVGDYGLFQVNLFGDGEDINFTVEVYGYDLYRGVIHWNEYSQPEDTYISFEPDKPEYLYGYTDSSVPGITYYAWKYQTTAFLYYTLSETPAEYAQIYVYQNNTMVADQSLNEISEYDGTTTPPRIRIHNDGGGGSFWMDRCTVKDKVIGTGELPRTLYTASTTLETDMILYDNTGTDSGYRVGAISQSGDSFDLKTHNVLNVEDYNYSYHTEDTVNLSEYIGQNTDVVAPEIEEVYHV